MNTTMDGAPRRAFQYWYDDGLVEIGMGLLFLLLAILLSVEGLAPAGSLPASFSALGLPVLLIGGMIVLGLTVRAAKVRLTYPRTGYVSYPRTAPARKWLAGVIGGLVSLLLVLFLATRPDWMVALPALQGAAIAAVLFLISYRSSVLRLAVPGILALAAGLAVGFLDLGTSSVGTALVFGVAGLAALVSGAVALVIYLRTTAPPAEAA